MATVPLNQKINFEGKTYRGGDKLPANYEKTSTEEKPTAAKSGSKKPTTKKG